MPLLKIPTPKMGERKIYGGIFIKPVWVDPTLGSPDLRGFYLKLEAQDPFGDERPRLRKKFVEMTEAYLRSKRPTCYTDLTGETFRQINFYRKSGDLQVLKSLSAFTKKYCQNYDEVKGISDEEAKLWGECLEIDKKLLGILDARGDTLTGKKADEESGELTDRLNALFRRLNSMGKIIEIALRSSYKRQDEAESADELVARVEKNLGPEYKKIAKSYIEDARSDPARAERLRNLELKKQKFLDEAHRSNERELPV